MNLKKIDSLTAHPILGDTIIVSKVNLKKKKSYTSFTLNIKLSIICPHVTAAVQLKEFSSSGYSKRSNAMCRKSIILSTKTKEAGHI